MKTHPIIFSTKMVQAILEGRKTMTRRVVKMYAQDDHPSRQNPQWYQENKTCPYGKPGDVLWVRESFGYYSNTLFYKSDDSLAAEKWKPSIHMPKAACRIWLEITNIRVERLQDITEEDAKKEGVIPDPATDHPSIFRFRFSFVDLWNSINAKKTAYSKLPTADWKSNPFVWVIEFKRIDKPENF